MLLKGAATARLKALTISNEGFGRRLGAFAGSKRLRTLMWRGVMKLFRKSSARLAAAALGLFALKAGAALAADLPSSKDVAPPPIFVDDTHFYARLGLAGIFYNGSATLTLGGPTFPGASATIPDNITALVEFGYFMTPNLSVQLTAGYPPTATLNGAGTINTLGTLGKVTYAPAVLSLNYHFKNFGPIEPYLGIGGAYAIIFSNTDGVVKNLNVDPNVGFVVQGGVDYFLNRNWSVYVDAKHIFLKVNATGTALGAPVTAVVTVDPTIVSGGVTYHW
jgi:outer membrane protein